MATPLREFPGTGIRIDLITIDSIFPLLDYFRVCLPWALSYLEVVNTDIKINKAPLKATEETKTYLPHQAWGMCLYTSVLYILHVIHESWYILGNKR